jgi:hypothetical protein
MTGYIGRFLEEFSGLPRTGTERTEETRPAPGSLGFLGIPREESSRSTLPPNDPPPAPPAPPSSLERTRPAGPDGWGPPPADRWWREAIGLWPVEWRERWGRRANELQDHGRPWDLAEWIAFRETARDLIEAERRGEVPESAYPDPAAHDGLSDEEVLAGIALAFGEAKLAPAGPSERGPRDVRRGDRWLPWHFTEEFEARMRRDHDRQERRGIDGNE